MPSRDNYAGQSRLKQIKRQLSGKLKNTEYEFTAARKEALKKAQEASAEARKLASGAVGGSQNTLSKTQVIANRFVNRVTGSKTSALKKRQTIKKKISTTANTAGSTARALTGTAAAQYRDFKKTANKKARNAGYEISRLQNNIDRGLSKAGRNLNKTKNTVKFKYNQLTTQKARSAYTRTDMIGNKNPSMSNKGFYDGFYNTPTGQAGKTTLKANYTQAGKSMQAGKDMLKAKNANRSKAGPTGAATTKSAYPQGNGNTSKSQFISRTVNRLTRNGAKPQTAKRTAENLWKQKQVNDRKNKRVK